MSLVSGIYSRGSIAEMPKSSGSRVNSFSNFEKELMSLEPGEMVSYKRNTFKDANTLRSCIWHGLRTKGVLGQFVTKGPGSKDLEFLVYVARKEEEAA